ncbi:hypothetical protein VINI7043_18948 [Vibrio nigripulchritudo ATCC 27043]|uniref:sensor domain-containing protein n=1 Tax=Vibrio nigripulchritudo TaxID=28173 RepID=UPI00021C11BD|nr:EAL domain-containing protein [Vibrio nigripulchritudo]EGU54510.1 hypothetical protein VINI7043_18948 [Vibrio nigripulchritudo ATCC 27043]
MREYEDFELLHNPIWIFDLDSKQIVWANSPALVLWESDSLDELKKRNLRSSMSMAVEATLEQYRKKFNNNEKVRTWWSFTPKRKLKCALCVFSGIEIAPGKTAMLVEVVAERNSLKRDLAFSGGGSLSLLFDHKGNLVSANEAFRLTFATSFYTLGDLLSSKIRAFEWLESAPMKQEIKEEISYDMDGKPHHFDVTAQWLFDKNQLLLTLVDITEKKQRLEEASFNACHDYLTGLYNRRGMLDVISEHTIQQIPFTLAFLDLDGFKLINDTYGHEVGDELLKAVTQRLKQCVPDGCILGRFGGDEFVLLFPQKGLDQVSSTLGQIIHLVANHYPINRIGDLSITASMGASHYPTNSQDVETLIKQSGMAMHQAKNEGRNRFELFSPTLSSTLNRKVLVRQRLSHAIERKAFTLVFQPILETQSDTMVGVEALLRWEDEKLGNVPPEEFIPLAEETGQIIEIGNWVLNEACKTLAEWKHVLPENFTMSVNISQIQVNNSLSKQLETMLNYYQIPSTRLALELTESAMVLKHEECGKWLNNIVDLGVRIYLDDFGTGYSSLSVLDALPISTIKLDKSFVHKCHKGSETIIKATVSLCNALDMTLIAEGIETEEQLSMIESHGCRYVQGFLRSYPLQKHTLESRYLNAGNDELIEVCSE